MTGAQPLNTILDDPDLAADNSGPTQHSGIDEMVGGAARFDLDDILESQGVCEDVSGGGASHEQFFSDRFDQLAKLHQLYQSVSSINAKCQSRLQESSTARGGGELDRRVNSLTALTSANDNASSSLGSVSDDLNSLCSEPAWISSSSAFLDINKNSTLSLNILDLCRQGGGLNSLSLTSLSSSHKPKATAETVVVPDDNESAAGGGGGNSLMDLDLDKMEERCDSPILEGIDSELAKYAKLRDLHQTYNPLRLGNRDLLSDANNAIRAGGVSSAAAAAGRLSSLRHPDGASNPDLTIKSETLAFSSNSVNYQDVGRNEKGGRGGGGGGGEPDRMNAKQSIEKVYPQGGGGGAGAGVVTPVAAAGVGVLASGMGCLSQRSPGTGRSSSGSDLEENQQQLRAAERAGGQLGAGARGQLGAGEGGQLGAGEEQQDLKANLSTHSRHSSNPPVLKHCKSPANSVPLNGDTNSRNKPELTENPASVCQKQPPPSQTVAEPKPPRDDKPPKEKPRIPRFSRLFGSTRKISRSPSQANKAANEDKLRSKSSKHKQKQIAAQQQQQQQLESEKKGSCGSGALTATVQKPKSFEDATALSGKHSKASSCKESKNAKGTLSSEPSCDQPRKRSRSLFRGLKKTRNQGVNLVRLPSDPSSLNRPHHSSSGGVGGSYHPAAAATVGYSPAATGAELRTGGGGGCSGELSGYDSGIDVTPRIRGKGANIQISRKVSRANCRSSGYESIGLEESERDSLDSCQVRVISHLKNNCNYLQSSKSVTPFRILFLKEFASIMNCCLCYLL